jgi:small subunit ribosomal protein S4
MARRALLTFGEESASIRQYYRYDSLFNVTKRISAKYKIDRRLGVNLWGRAKSPYATRNYGPGQHGKQPSKLSDYGVQLRAKQMLKGYYGNISEKQFRNIYKKAIRSRGDTSEIMIELLERRLDAVVYRLKFAPTVFAARQLVNHGHILVNGKRVDIPSYNVKDGDEVAIADKMKQNVNIVAATELQERGIPEYIEVDHSSMKGTFVRGPKISDVPYAVHMSPNLVVEFYSR